jgi:hypothetical protein
MAEIGEWGIPPQKVENNLMWVIAPSPQGTGRARRAEMQAQPLLALTHVTKIGRFSRSNTEQIQSVVAILNELNSKNKISVGGSQHKPKSPPCAAAIARLNGSPLETGRTTWLPNQNPAR